MFVDHVIEKYINFKFNNYFFPSKPKQQSCFSNFKLYINFNFNLHISDQKCKIY